MPWVILWESLWLLRIGPTSTDHMALVIEGSDYIGVMLIVKTGGDDNAFSWSIGA